MLKMILRAAFAASAAGMLLAPTGATADPTNLRLSFFTSDRSQIYRALIKPYVDAVNDDGGEFVHIEVFFSGAISGVQSRQPQLVSDGTADLALVVPGRTPERFHDTSVLELPGLFRNSLEGSRVFTQLLGDNVLSGYPDFYVVAGMVSGPENVHSRKPIASLAELKGLRIRVNNQIEAEVLGRLGAVPVLLAINQTTEAMSSGAIDGATAPPSMLFEFGISRVATYHYMIGLGGVPVALLMNRKRFESLPLQAQTIIRKYSGEWLSDHAATQFDAWDSEVVKTLEADQRRTVTFPNDADTARIKEVYADVIKDYADSSDRNSDLFARVRADVAKQRAAE